MSVECARRFYLLKRRAAVATGDEMASVWAAKQNELPGVALGASFPYVTRLSALGYTAHEDLFGATAEELQQAGFTNREAAAVLAAL